jgi:hypothetical protein
MSSPAPVVLKVTNILETLAIPYFIHGSLHLMWITCDSGQPTWA